MEAIAHFRGTAIAVPVRHLAAKLAKGQANAAPADLYRAGRARFLTRLLESPHIYLSDRFRAEREASARANVRRAREELLAK